GKGLDRGSVQASDVTSDTATSGRLDLHDLELDHGAAGGRDLDGLALLATDDRLADRRLVRELLLGGIRLRGADDVVLDRLLRVDVTHSDARHDTDDARLEL